jgi:cyclophilin family peptidyl-prolyl cis-trans isomerase
MRIALTLAIGVTCGCAPRRIEATRAWAPLGADRFYNLVRGGFYNGVHFHRAVPKFVVQFGINPEPGSAKPGTDRRRSRTIPFSRAMWKGS